MGRRSAEEIDEDANSKEIVKAKAILQDLLRKNDGAVSTRAFKKMLEQKGFENVRDIVRYFKYSDENENGKEGIFHLGRSFLNEKAYKKEQDKTELEAESSGEEEVEEDEEEQEEVEEIVTEHRKNRKEEARLVKYVCSSLENIYGTEFGPDVDIVFDVHNDRAGNKYENVDIIAIHWRSDDIVESVAVEVKLRFSSSLVMQAKNYTRFADRVWLAVPVQANAAEAAVALREKDPLLFDYVLAMGIGILGCKRTQGKGYEVFPIHWPSLNRPTNLEKSEFKNRHKAVFQQAGVLPAESKSKVPTF